MMSPRPPWPIAVTAGTFEISPSFLPDASSSQRLPSFSETNARPSGRKVMAQALSKVSSGVAVSSVPCVPVTFMDCGVGASLCWALAHPISMNAALLLMSERRMSDDMGIPPVADICQPERAAAPPVPIDQSAKVSGDTMCFSGSPARYRWRLSRKVSSARM